MRSALCLALLLIAAPLAAKDDVYRWVDAEGVIHYGSKPPSKDAKPVELPQLQTYRPSPSRSALPSAVVPAPAVKSSADNPPLDLRITAPVEGETFRDPQGVISVSVAITPGPPDGATYQFYLDGVAQNKKPWGAPSYTLTEVERGEHRISVALLSATGTELKRTAEVQIFQMPPTVPPKKGG